MALERQKNLKRAGVHEEMLRAPGVVEELWEDELLCKIREFNKSARERPHDEKVWLTFAEFQDKVAEMQPQKGACLQTLEKKISILEKATELNPDNEELLLCLLRAYKRNPEREDEGNVALEQFQEEIKDEDDEQDDDTEALLKMLGIDVDVGASGEVKDISTWIRWSEEEKSRDSDQWMPVHAASAAMTSNNGEADEHLSRVIMYEDIKEYLFSLSSLEAHLSQVLQFIDFFGGKTSQWISTNSSMWSEKLLSLEALPQSILQTLRKVHALLSDSQGSSTNFSLEFLLGATNDIHGKSDLMKFLHNATLLCLSSFPRNYLLEEAALVAEEVSAVNLNPTHHSVTPCEVEKAMARWFSQIELYPVCERAVGSPRSDAGKGIESENRPL